jgi:hypothetical protein
MDIASAADFVRGNRLARVKFVALPVETKPGNAFRTTPRLSDRWGRLYPGARAAAIRKFVLRVIGRLVAARP